MRINEQTTKQDPRVPQLGTHIHITEFGISMVSGPINQTIEDWVKTWIPRAKILLMGETLLVTREDWFDWKAHPRNGEGELDPKATEHPVSQFPIPQNTGNSQKSVESVEEHLSQFANEVL